jgi:hypothetical protein
VLSGSDGAECSIDPECEPNDDDDPELGREFRVLLSGYPYAPMRSSTVDGEIMRGDAEEGLLPTSTENSASVRIGGGTNPS